MVRRANVANAGRARHSNCAQLLRVAAVVQQQSVQGDDLHLSPSELAVAARVASELSTQLSQESPYQEVKLLWDHPSQDTVALLALFGLALRRSSPFDMGDEENASYATVRKHLCGPLALLLVDREHLQKVCSEYLGQVLLQTDTLQCYCRLLSEAAEQLRPAAAVHFPAPAQSHASPGAAAAVTPAGLSGEQEQGRQRPPGPGPAVQLQAAPPPQPCMQQLGSLLHEVINILAVLGIGLQHLKGGGGADAGTSSSSSSSPNPASQRMLSARAQVQSSGLLEHWARALLLGTPAAIADLHGRQQKEAQTAQGTYLYALCHMHRLMQLDWADFVRRPCGGTLASIHMAYLCAALDGGSAFGLARPAVINLPAGTAVERDFLWDVDPRVADGEEELVSHHRMVGTLPAQLTLRAWIAMLGGTTEAPGAAGGGAQLPAEADPSGVETGAGAGQDAGDDGAGQGEGAQGGEPREGPLGPTPASLGICSLPPLNRFATVTLCLRLAKGVLACWGQSIADVRLVGDGVGRGSGSGSLLLPKTGGCTVLFSALACARLALLPLVWGRERVSRAVRVQLRVWWETYMAAAQHREALLVGEPQPLAYPSWTNDVIAQGQPLLPFADTAVALEAGLLPCMSQLVTRMGAGSLRGAIYFPPSRFPGTDPCMQQLLLHGPLGQVYELAAALGQRLHVAVEELREAVAAGPVPEGSRGGRAVRWLAETAYEAMQEAAIRLDNTFWCALIAMQAVGGAAEGAGGGQLTAADLGVRVGALAAELLPPLSRGLQLCAELGRNPDRHPEFRGNGIVQLQVNVTERGFWMAACALDYAILLLARHGKEVAAAAAVAAAEELPGGSDAAAAASGSGGGGGGHAAHLMATPWRQLLLQDMGLMGLLGAVLQLRAQAAWAQAQDRDPAATAPAPDRLCYALARILQLAAIAFPAEFRSAVPGAAARTVPGAAATDQSSGAGGSTEASGAAAVFLFAVREVMDAASAPVGMGLVRNLVRDEDWEWGWGDATLHTWGTAQTLWCMYDRLPSVQLSDLAMQLPPPAEARAAVAAAAARGAA